MSLNELLGSTGSVQSWSNLAVNSIYSKQGISFGATGVAPNKLLATDSSGTLIGLTSSTGPSFISANLQTLNVSNNANFSGSTGIFLATSGGTPSSLNYYEELVTTSTFNGIWAGSNVPATKLIRIGKMVQYSSANINSAQTTASVATTLAGAIPARFCPTTDVTSEILVIDDTPKPGRVNVSSDGTILIDVNTSNFGGTGGGGWYPFTVSWSVL